MADEKHNTANMAKDEEKTSSSGENNSTTPQKDTSIDTSSPESTSKGQAASDGVSPSSVSAEEETAQVVAPSKYDEIETGMTIRVYQRIKEVNAKGVEKEREQYFEGIVLARKHGKEIGSTITVRKISNGVGVEKIFPLNLPTISKILILKKLKQRKRSKLYFLRWGYKKRLREERVM